MRLPATTTRLTQMYPEPRPDLGVIHGDCVRTAMAMVLGCKKPSDVPHYETWPERRNWLRQRGLEMLHLPIPCKSADCLAEHIPGYLNGYPALLTGTTCEGHGHCVAVIDDKVVDTVPWSEENPLVAPDSDGWYWLNIIVPIPHD